MPLTTRFLFEVMPESKIDPCAIDKFGLHRDQNPHPLKITKDAPPRVKNKTNGNSKTETSQGNGNQNKFTNKFGLHRDQNPHPLKITKGAPPRVKNKSQQIKITANQNHRQGQDKSKFKITDKATQGQFKTNS
jgi:ribosomal protein S30